MLTEKDYCDYETCVALKELGYVGTGEECSYFGAYFNNGEDIFSDDLNNNEIAVNEYLRAPLFLAQKWLREEKGVVVLVHHLMTQEGDWEWEISYRYRSKDMYHSYEEALSEGIEEAIKILKEK